MHIIDFSADVIQNICNYLDCWQDINNFGRTCKNFDEIVTHPEKPICVNCCLKRQTNQSSKDFLDGVIHLLCRIVQRKGRNPILLTLAHNQLSDDVPAFYDFIKQCTESDVVDFLVEFNIGMNGLVDLPQNLTQLHSLQSLQIHSCTYGLDGSDSNLLPKSLELISTMTWVKELNISNNNISELPASFANLVQLRRCFLSCNNLTQKSLSLCKTFKYLRELHVCYNAVTLEEIFRLCPHWPDIKEIEAAYLEKGDMALIEQDIFARISPHVEITIAYPSRYKCQINEVGSLDLY